MADRIPLQRLELLDHVPHPPLADGKLASGSDKIYDRGPTGRRKEFELYWDGTWVIIRDPKQGTEVWHPAAFCKQVTPALPEPAKKLKSA